MARYNHFADCKYEDICFGEVAIGEKFRMDKHTNKRRRKDLICVKTGDLTYCEFKSKKEYTLRHSAFDVSHFSKRVGLPTPHPLVGKDFVEKVK